jgi:hypothetical protein
MSPGIIIRVCSRCGEPLIAGKSFCANCGASRPAPPRSHGAQSVPQSSVGWVIVICSLVTLLLLFIAVAFWPSGERSKETTANPEPPTVKQTCRFLHATLDRKPIGELTRNELASLNACEKYVDNAPDPEPTWPHMPTADEIARDHEETRRMLDSTDRMVRETEGKRKQ